MKQIALAFAFILELIAFLSFGALAYLLPINEALRAAGFIVLLAAVLVFWSQYMAPRAPHKLAAVHYYVAKAAIYAAAAVGVYGHKGYVWCALFAAAAIADDLVLAQHNLSRRK